MTPVNYELEKLKRVSSIYGDPFRDHIGERLLKSPDPGLHSHLFWQWQVFTSVPTPHPSNTKEGMETTKPDVYALVAKNNQEILQKQQWSSYLCCIFFFSGSGQLYACHQKCTAVAWLPHPHLPQGHEPNGPPLAEWELGKFYSAESSTRQVVTKQSLATSTTKLVLTQESPPFAEACTTSRFHQHLEKICLRLHRHQNMARTHNLITLEELDCKASFYLFVGHGCATPGKHARMAGSAGLWPECAKLQPTATITAQKNLQLSMKISYMVIPCSSMFRWLGTCPLGGTEIWRATIPLHGHTTVARISLHVQLLGFNRSESLASIQPEGWLLWFHVVEETALR